MNMQGYTWGVGSSKQVVYTSDDLHIHELWVSVGGRWAHEDLTMRAGGPSVAEIGGHLTAYAWEAGMSKQVAYIGHDRHIHELYVVAGGTWQHADLTTLTGAPAAADAKIVGYAWEQGHAKQVLYQTTDGHIHELYVVAGGTWQHVNLTALISAPLPVVAKLTGYAWEAGQSKQIVYLTGDGHIHELHIPVDGTWQHVDLTALTSAPLVPLTTLPEPPMGGMPSPVGRLDPDLPAYAWEAGRAKQIVYWTQDGHLHELYVSVGGEWAHQDLHALPTLAGAPLAESGRIAAYAWEEGRAKQIVYASRDNHIHELSISVGGVWQHTDVTASTRAATAAIGWLGGYSWDAGHSKQIVYADRRIHELYFVAGGSWGYSDLTAATSSPLVR
jgi:hypothetical protein